MHTHVTNSVKLAAVLTFAALTVPMLTGSILLSVLAVGAGE